MCKFRGHFLYENSKRISKEYTGKVSHIALSSINLTITEGEFVGIMGPSGSEKTTLLNMISTIDSPTSGSVYIHNTMIWPYFADRIYDSSYNPLICCIH